MKRQFGLLALTLILMMGTSAAWAGESYERQVDHRIDGGEVRLVEIANLAGRVFIEGSADGNGEIRATIHALDSGDRSAESVAALLKMEFEVKDGKLRAKARYPLDDHRDYYYGGGKSYFSGDTQVKVDGKKVKISSKKKDGLPLWVDIHVLLPAGVDCDLRHRVGQVELRELNSGCRVDCASADVLVYRQNGDLEVDSGSGDVKVDTMTGDLLVDTGSGDIELKDFAGSLEADTGSGDVTAANLSGDRVDVDTGSGDIQLEGLDSPRLVVDTGSGDVEISSPGGQIDVWDADTGSGDVVLTLPASASFRLEVDTGNGDVTCELTGKDIKLDRGEIRSLTVGDGAGRIRVDTGSGDVKIAER